MFKALLSLKLRSLLNRTFALLVLLYIAAGSSFGQLFPGLTDEELADAIRDEFTPGQLLNDTQVKDTLYARVFSKDDSVRCIYSGLARFLPSGQDPSQWLFGTGLETGSLNLEHTWPQSKGAGEGTSGNTNMYHLFPSRTAINADRGDFPFSEIPDHQTTRWYYRDQQMSNIPGVNIQGYSEYINGSFEPRESVKGDIARGMFYFWTIYRDDAIAADPFFFNLQLEDLCLWHAQDPVDDDERVRNDVIATYQDGKKNPFIIDCSLVMRAYCNQLPECVSVSTHNPTAEEFFITYLPEERQVLIVGKGSASFEVFITDLMGRKGITEILKPGEISHFGDLPSGIYVVVAAKDDQVLSQKIYIP